MYEYRRTRKHWHRVIVGAPHHPGCNLERAHHSLYTLTPPGEYEPRCYWCFTKPLPAPPPNRRRDRFRRALPAGISAAVLAVCLVVGFAGGVVLSPCPVASATDDHHHHASESPDDSGKPSASPISTGTPAMSPSLLPEPSGTPALSLQPTPSPTPHPWASQPTPVLVTPTAKPTAAPSCG